MRLLVSSLTGVIVACLIFSVIFFAPRYFSPKVLLGISVGGEQLEMVGPQGVAYQEAPRGPSPCILNVTLYEFTAPLGPGSEADLMITLTSKRNMSEVFRVYGKLDSGPSNCFSPEELLNFTGLSFADGGSEWDWAGSIEPNGTRSFSYRIRAPRTCVGVLDIGARMIRSSEGECTTCGLVSLSFTVVPDNVLVFSQSPYPLGNPWGWASVSTTTSYEMGGVGSESNVSVSLFGFNETDVTLKLVLPSEGIVLVNGQTEWAGNVTHGEEVRLSTKVRFSEIGTWFIYAYVEKDGILLGPPTATRFIVSEDIVLEYPFA
jgi:hypothetical protein